MRRACRGRQIVDPPLRSSHRLGQICLGDFWSTCSTSITAALADSSFARDLFCERVCVVPAPGTIPRAAHHTLPQHRDNHHHSVVQPPGNPTYHHHRLVCLWFFFFNCARAAALFCYLTTAPTILYMTPSDLRLLTRRPILSNPGRSWRSAARAGTCSTYRAHKIL